MSCLIPWFPSHLGYTIQLVELTVVETGQAAMRCQSIGSTTIHDKAVAGLGVGKSHTTLMSNEFDAANEYRN